MHQSIVAIIKKVRIWGFIGVWNYLKTVPSRVNLRAYLHINAILHPCKASECGISLIGPFSQRGSASKVLRDFAAALKESGVPYQTLDTGMARQIPQQDLYNIMTPRKQFRILKFDHVVEILPSVLPTSLQGDKHARIAFWEFDSGFLHAYPDMPVEGHVIAMSDFNSEYLSRELTNNKVSKILYPFRHHIPDVPSRSEIRKKYGIPEDSFVVYFNFDFNAGYNRKNPDGAICAFSRAKASMGSSRLVIKTKGASTHAHEYKRLISTIEDCRCSKETILINDYIPESDIYGLTNACDVYISLHRGEGFGLTLAEAMCMGKPVVCTNWSSTTEFCREGCCIPVEYKLTEPRIDQIDHPYYKKVKRWAEPDINAAAAAICELYANPDRREEIGRNAAVSIKNQFSCAQFKKSVEEFLQS